MKKKVKKYVKEHLQFEEVLNLIRINKKQSPVLAWQLAHFEFVGDEALDAAVAMMADIEFYNYVLERSVKRFYESRHKGKIEQTWKKLSLNRSL